MTLLEGDAGTTSAEVRVLLEPASTNTVSVAYQTADGTAVAGQDYVSASGTLTFAPGEVLKTVLIPIVGDTVPESDESFSVVLSQPKMALLGAARADVVIANDDTPVHATIADLEVDEGNDGVKSVPITINFDRPVPGSGKIQVRLVGVTAVADQDFANFSQTLYPPAGATQMTFTVDILSDTQAECDEGLLIQYTEAYLGDDTTKTAKMVLRNDDEPALGCADPFTHPPVVEPGRDGGAPLPQPVDADKLRDFGDLGIDGSAATGGGDAYGGSTNATDTQAASGIGLGNDIPDSGSAPIDQRIGGSSGCACSLSGPSRDTSLLVFAVAGILAVLVRRSRAR